MTKKFSKSSSSGAITISKNTVWKAVTAIFAVLVVLSIFTEWFIVGEKIGSTTEGSGKVVIEEYSDFQCPFCGKFFKETFPQIKAAYGDRVEFVYKHFPLSFHENAQNAAEASECARDQGEFWQYHDLLFENQQALDVTNLKKYATDLSLDVEKFNDCLDNHKKQDVVQRDMAEGQQRGVTGTPAFLFNNGEKISGAQPFSAFKTAIDRALSGQAAPAPQVAQPSQPAQRVEASVDDDPTKGDADAPVTIIEFSDFQCPFCARFFSQTLPQIENEYIKTGKARLVYRDYPLDFHPYAQKAAEAAECADDQNKFWEMHDKIFQNQNAITTQDLKQYAQDLNLNTATFNDCLDTNKHASEVQKDLADGQAAGVTGTPAFVINGKLVTGAQPFSAFKQAIDAALAEASE